MRPHRLPLSLPFHLKMGVNETFGVPGLSEESPTWLS